MRNLPALLAFLILIPILSFSQDADSTATLNRDSDKKAAIPDSLKNWKHDATLSIGFNQAAFSSNWTAGGQNSVGFTSQFLYNGKYKKDKKNWVNIADLQYGFINVDGTGYRKNIDKIYLDTRVGYEFKPKWNAVAGANFLSQFAPGFKYENDSLDREIETRISDFLAPGYLTIGLGIEYNPTKYFSARLSPFAPRFTFVTDTNLYLDVPDNYGVEIGETVRVENGLQIFMDFNKEILKNLTLKAKYLGYYNYEKDFDNMDHRIDAVIEAKVNKLINVSLNGIVVYDTDQDKDVQWNQAFTLNFAYTLRNYTPEKKK